MKSQIKLGRYFGVEIGLHLSWFIIAFLIAMSLVQRFAARHPDWSTWAVWTTALVTNILFFITLVIHEMAHSLVAKAHGIPVKAITLFALGGVSQIEKESDTARTEFWIGIAGPLTSLAIGLLCLALAFSLGRRMSNAVDSPAISLLVWLGYINLGLAFFNLIPGFPLDGGRVLRALLWWGTGDGLRATRLAAKVGRWIALCFIFMGIVEFFKGSGIGGLWLGFIGLFLNEAARGSSLHVEWHAALKDLSVKDVMTSDCPVVPGGIDLETFVNQFMLRTGRRCFLVEDQGSSPGILTPEEVKRIDKSKWSFTTARQAARGLDQFPKVHELSPAEAAFQSMERNRLDEEAVVSDGHVVGFVSRTHILEILRAHNELKI